MDVLQLQDVLPKFSKKLILMFSIADLQEQLIMELNELFKANAGETTVTFEVMELERVKTIVQVPVVSEMNDSDEMSDVDESLDEVEITIPEEKEEIKVITKLSMPSRKLKIGVSNAVLSELERLQINFKLN